MSSLSCRKLISLVFALMLSSSVLSQQTENDKEFDNMIQKKFEKFVAKFNKVYSSQEEKNEKFLIFKQNYLKAKQKNKEVEKSEGEEKKFGTTQFMDMTEEDFGNTYLRLNASQLPDEKEMAEKSMVKMMQSEAKTNNSTGRFLQDSNSSYDIPEEWDWRKQGALNPVRNQGACGACWAFSAVSNIESQVFLKYGLLTSYSEQQLIDCDYTNSGCYGGIMNAAFTYIKNWGLEKRKAYPYEFQQGTCNYNTSDLYWPVNSYLWAGTDDEDTIAAILYKFGPLSITINASLLQYYYGGVLDVPYSWCPYSPNHGVNLVGYGKTSSGLKYWIVRNTWGPQWGEEGYFRIVRGKGLCGVNKYVVTSVIN